MDFSGGDIIRIDAIPKARRSFHGRGGVTTRHPRRSASSAYIPSGCTAVTSSHNSNIGKSALLSL